MRPSLALSSLIALLTAPAALLAQSAVAPPAPPAPPQAVPAIAPAVPTIAPRAQDFDTIADHVTASPQLTQLARAVAAAGLAPALEAEGPFTLLAPVDSAFARLGAGQAEALLAEDQRAALTALLQLHVVPGYLTHSELRRQLQLAGGAAQLPTLAGETLTARIELGDVIVISDANGALARFTGPAQPMFNGIVLPIDVVVRPAAPKGKARRR